MTYYSLTKFAEEHPADTVAKGVGTALIGTGAGALLAQRGKADKLKELREKVKGIRGASNTAISDLVNKINDKGHYTYQDVLDDDYYMEHHRGNVENAKRSVAAKIPNADRYLEAMNASLEANTPSSMRIDDTRKLYVKKLEDQIQDIHAKGKSDIAGLKDDFNKFYNERTKRMALKGLGAGVGFGLGYGAYKAYQHSKNKPMAKTASDEQRESPMSIGIKGLGAGILSERIGNAIGHTLSNKHKLRDTKNLQEDIRLASDPFERKMDFNKYRLDKIISVIADKEKEHPGQYILENSKPFVQELGEKNTILNAEKAKAVQAVTDKFNKKHQDIASRAKKLGGNIGAGIGLGGYGAYKAYQHFKNKDN